ncbi:MAG: class I SAM-dependent RNA methyltransferase [Betaproteobacteria bacterium]
MNDLLALDIEKPAAGGRMIARLDGRVVLVAGAIPGERVRARVERVAKGVVYAEVVDVEAASPDRRAPFVDPLCGGCLFAHIRYGRQLEIKSQVIEDAFARIGRAPLVSPVPVAGSPDEGYRMRGRLHLRGGRLGFFREGTHEVCDARATRQLLPSTCDVLDRVAAGLRSLGASGPAEIELSENVNASERVLHVDGERIDAEVLRPLAGFDGISGLLSGSGSIVSGSPFVHDEIDVSGRSVRLRRHIQAFFQGNRYLLRDLVTRVISHLPQDGALVDLYAGAGLFAVAAAVARGGRVTAIEGDRVGAADLEANAAACGAAVVARHQSVEEFTARAAAPADAVVVDPPRTGMSREALAGVLRLRAPRVVYVSCDVATLARDARRLLDAGYAIGSVEAFDLFPNTPHVECVVSFSR